MKILVIEDEKRIADSLRTGLMQEKCVVDVAYDGQTGYDLAESGDYDLIVLDLMLPLKDGIQICKDLRIKNITTPILMLTAKSETDDKVVGLNTGADDYLTKPFSFDELLARIRAIARRPKTLSSSDIDKLAQILSQREYQIYDYFLRNKNKIISKNDLISKVWSFDADVLPNTVEVNIRNLRNKLGKDVIKTVRGFGYVLQSKN